MERLFRFFDAEIRYSRFFLIEYTAGHRWAEPRQKMIPTDIDTPSVDPVNDIHVGQDCIPINSASVQGRLKQHSVFWENTLAASKFILDIIRTGYKLPFIKFPIPYFQENHRMSLANETFVKDAIQELSGNNCVRLVEQCPTVCSPLQVVSNARGKRRLVIDLRYVNKFLQKCKFKYEGIDIAAQMLDKGDFFIIFDLKSGYHHVDIHPDYWQYLGFSWNKEGGRKFYVFTVLPFGLASACYVFTKLLRPLVKRWRSLGLKVILYIDDGICSAKTADKAEENALMLTRDLDQSGFVLNREKSCLIPQKIGKWLGVLIDLKDGDFHIPKERIEKLKSDMAAVLSDKRPTVRALAKVTGQIISMSIAVGPITRLRTRGLYSLINSRVFWSDRLETTAEVRDELAFWQQNIHGLNGRPIRMSPSATRVAFSDASSSGYGGFVVEIGPHISHGQWSTQEASYSSTWRELKAVDQVLRSFSQQLEGHTIKWCTDNQNVVRIVESGSRKPYLQDGALSIFEECIRYGIKLEMTWIPRSSNEQADYISRIVDYDDWQVDPELFCYLDNVWGPHTVDNFAAHTNWQVPNFHSKFWNPGSSAIDTFTTSWQGQINWVVPPVYLVCRAIRHARECNARGTILIPAWNSAPFWPILFPDGCHLAGFIHGWYSFPFYSGMFMTGRSGNNIGNAMNSDSHLLALLFDFSVPPRMPYVQPAFKYC